MLLSSTLSDRQIQARLKYSLRTSPLFKEHGSLVVQRDGGEVIVSYTAREESTCLEFALEGALCYLDYLKRDVRYRGRGLGRQLYLCLEMFLRGVGCTRVRLTPIDENAYNFWVSLGFRLTDEGDLEKIISS